MFKNKFMKRTSIVLGTLLMALQLNFGGPLNNNDNKQRLKNYGNVEAVAYAAGLDYTWNNTIPEKIPAPTNNNGKLVLFDNSHGETTGQADWVLDGGFSDFADDLVAHGYTVREYRGVDKNIDGAIRYYDDRQSGNVALNEAVITYDGIKNADVFVMAEANRPFSISERAALKQFVDSGKGIYFVADHYNADRNMNTWDSTEVFNGYNRSTSTSYNMGGEYGDLRNPQNANTGWLAENFGIRYRFNAINWTNGLSGIKSVADSEGITAGVQPILMAAGSTLAVVDGTKAKGLVYFGATDSPTKWASAADQGLYFGGENEGPFVAISKPSLGKAAFIGDSSPIEDLTTKYKNEGSGAAKSTHAGYTSAGTAAVLSVNLVDWLANTETYVGFDGISHTRGINTPIPMADVEKTQSQAEPWATPTYDPWNTSTFAYGSYNAPQGPISGVVSVTGITLTPSSVALNVGSIQTITANITPSNATNKTVTWTSNNTSVATVVNGVVTANAIGTAIITATTQDGGKTATCNVTVSNGTVGDGSSQYPYLVAQAIVNQDNTLKTVKGYVVGQPTAANTVITSAYPDDNALALADSPTETDTAKMVYVQISTTFRSTFGLKTNPTLKGTSIKVTGYLTPYFSPHSGVKNLTNMEKVTQTISVTGVTLDKTTTTLNVGNTQTLTATVSPADSTDKTITWTSSNATVATVSNGVVTAKAQGTAVITVTTVDGGKTATCNVTVTSTVGDGSSLNPYSVAQSIANQTNTLKTVKGYVVGEPTAANTVIISAYPDDYALALADNPNETDTTKMVYVQISTTYRSTFGLKTNPSLKGISIKVTGYLTPYFSPHAGVKNITQMEK